MDGNKSELERLLEAGISGTPELGREEKKYYLGEFRERVLRLLTKSQVGEFVVYPEIAEALRDSRTYQMVVNGGIRDEALEKYRKLAEEYRIPFTKRHDADFVGDTGLLIVSRQAVDVEEIHVVSRKVKLLTKGLPEQLIDAAGEAVCKDCFAKVKAAAPEELRYYSIMNPISRLFGEKCPGHE